MKKFLVTTAFALALVPAIAHADGSNAPRTTLKIEVGDGYELTKVNRKPSAAGVDYCQAKGGKIVVIMSTCQKNGRKCSGGCQIGDRILQNDGTWMSASANGTDK